TLALKTNSSSIILCHNHPSGNICPSESDISLTHTLFHAGQLLGIKLLDHLIIAQGEAYYSFADQGEI
ncbi:MAG: DNA repair protein, partial [Bacteroidetes bacterium]|nr:DNA repair protein [Bacteroidota bacterium]